MRANCVQTSLDRQAQQVADSITKEFFRLGIDTDTDPISGLMTRCVKL